MRASDPYAVEADEQRWFRWMFVLCLLVVTHGSLYPWLFAAPASYGRALRILFKPDVWTGGGDVIGNVLLFVPVGALGWLAAQTDGRVGTRRLLALVAGSLVFAFALQVLQVWLPKRSPAVSDVLWNAVGLGLGLRYAEIWRTPVLRVRSLWDSPHRVAFALAGLWLVMVWWPLLPLLNRRQLGLALHQLTHLTEASLGEIVTAALGVAVVAGLMQPLRHRLAWALGLVAVAFAGKFVFAKQVVLPEHVYGWLLGLVLAILSWRLDRRSGHQAMLVAALGAWLMTGLVPFALAPTPGPFHVMPFDAALSEPRVVHSLALGWEIFWLAAVLTLVRGLGAPLRSATVALALATAALEVVQRWLPGQQADITPVLVLPLLGLALAHLERATASPRRAPHAAAPRRQDA